MSDNSKLQTFNFPAWSDFDFPVRCYNRPIRAHDKWRAKSPGKPYPIDNSPEMSFRIYLDDQCSLLPKRDPKWTTWKCPDEEGEFLLSHYMNSEDCTCVGMIHSVDCNGD